MRRVPKSGPALWFQFGDDPEFKFTSHKSLIPPWSTAVVLATFYNVDGHCQPRRTSLILRCIRIRSNGPEDVERFWKKTPPTLVGEKRWRFRFEKDHPNYPACDETVPLWATGDAGTERSSLLSPKIQMLCFARSSWSSLIKCFAAAIVLAALYRMLLPANPRLTKTHMGECVTLWGNTYCF